MIPYYSDRNYLVIAANLGQVSLLPLSDFNIVEHEIATTTIPSLSYGIFRYQTAYSLLALLCSDGVVHVWQASADSNQNGHNALKSICTLSALDSLPPLYPSDMERRKASAEEKAAQMYSILIYSPTKILTGHRDGKIRVWDLSPILKNSSSDHVSSATPTDVPTVTSPVYTVQPSEAGPVINGLLLVPPSPNTKADILSTDTNGFVKLWCFSGSNSSNPYELQLISQYRLFDHAITCSAITINEKWFVAGGKDGGEESNVCGLEGRVRALRLDSFEGKDKAVIKELGYPSLTVWKMKSFKVDRGERLVVSLMKKGRAWLEIWDTGDL
jgi:WD40 repeat protein